jgi:hypothetical protein
MPKTVCKTNTTRATLVEMKGLELPERIEEKQANRYASEFVKKP